jgi:hypothetical protein
MSAPWAEEWDYVQFYRGMFGWGDVGKGFYSRALRKKGLIFLPLGWNPKNKCA